jgi:hypothetical protein
VHRVAIPSFSSKSASNVLLSLTPYLFFYRFEPTHAKPCCGP